MERNLDKGKRANSLVHSNPAGLGAIVVGTKFHDQVYADGVGLKPLEDKFDEFEIFNRALSLTEIEELATAFISREDQIIALELKTVNEGKTPDDSFFGSDNAGILNNGVLIDEVTETANFDGVDDYISFESTDDLNLLTHNKRTISVSFKADNIDINQGKQVVYEEGGGSRGLNIYLHDGSLYVGAWHSIEADWTTFISTDEIEAGAWHHVTPSA